MRVKDQANITTIMALVMLVCFMLPWLKVGGVMTLDGIDIPGAAKKAGVIFSLETYKGGTNFKAYISYILYLIPIATVLIIIQQIRDRSVTLLAVVAGVVPLLLAIQLIVNKGMAAFNQMQFGLYISLVAGILMILDSAGIIKIPGLSTRR